MADNYNVRQFRSGDEYKIIELLELVFGGWPHFDLKCSSLDHWYWKFEGYHPENQIICVAESGEKIIGCNQGQYARIKIGDAIILSRQGVDTAVHPDFRGKGVYSRLDKMKDTLYEKTDIKFVYFATTNPIVVKVDVKLGSRPFPHAVTKMIRVRNVDSLAKERQNDSFFKKLEVRYLVKIAKLFNRFERFLLKTPKNDSDGLLVSDLEVFDEQANTLWDEEKKNYSFIKERTSEYLNWRYRDLRGGDYIVKQVRQGNTLLGYMVLRIKKYNPGQIEGYIIDVFTPLNRPDCFEALVREGVKFFDDAGVNTIYYCGVMGHPYLNLLKRYEFLDSRSIVNIYFGATLDEGNLSQFINAPPGRLLLHFGDMDWI